MPCAAVRLHLAPRRAVVSRAVDLGPLQQLPGRRSASLEPLARPEVVVDPSTSPGRGGARGRRDRPPQRQAARRPAAGRPASTSAPLGPETTIRRAGGGTRSIRHRRWSPEPVRVHSTFCTSSRTFSSVALISTTCRETATSPAFEPIVFASRPISWTTNSSFRPAARRSLRTIVCELVQVAAPAASLPRPRPCARRTRATSRIRSSGRTATSGVGQPPAAPGPAAAAGSRRHRRRHAPRIRLQLVGDRWPVSRAARRPSPGPPRCRIASSFAAPPRASARRPATRRPAAAGRPPGSGATPGSASTPASTADAGRSLPRRARRRRRGPAPGSCAGRGVEREVGRPRPARSHRTWTRSVPRRTCLRTTFSSSGLEHRVRVGPRTETFRWRLLTARTSTRQGQAVRLVAGLAEAGHAQQHAVPASVGVRVGRRDRPLRLPGRVGCSPRPRLHHLDVDHDDQHPDARDRDGDLGERVAGPGAERARPAGPAERPGQPAPFAPLDQDGQDQQQAEADDDEVQQVGPETARVDGRTRKTPTARGEPHPRVRAGAGRKYRGGRRAG